MPSADCFCPHVYKIARRRSIDLNESGDESIESVCMFGWLFHSDAMYTLTCFSAGSQDVASLAAASLNFDLRRSKLEREQAQCRCTLSVPAALHPRGYLVPLLLPGAVITSNCNVQAELIPGRETTAGAEEARFIRSPVSLALPQRQTWSNFRKEERFNFYFIATVDSIT